MATLFKMSSLINDRYIVDVESSGLCYDLRLLHPQFFGDADKLNAEVDRIRGILNADPGGEGRQWRPCLGLTRKQWMEEMREDHRTNFTDKVYIMLYEEGWENGMEIPDIEVYHKVDFVCIPKLGEPQEKWEVYTPWNADALGYRFKIVPVPDQETPSTPGNGSSENGSTTVMEFSKVRITIEILK